MNEVHYGPESQMRQPLRLAGSMLRDLAASRGLAWRLMVRNISAAYRQTVFGYLWAFLPPLGTAAVFIGLNRGGVFQAEGQGIPMALWTLVGVFLWQAFADAVLSPIRLVSQSKEMLAKINFPREALILAGLGEVFFNFLIRLLILVPVMLWYRVGVGPGLLLAPLGVLALLCLGVMVGLLLSPAAILFQDVEKGLPMLLPIWMLVSDAAVPLPTHGALAALARWNPVVPLLQGTRDLLTGQPLHHAPLVLGLMAATFLLLLLGWLLYRISLPHLISRIPA